ncbi:MAG: undecaprenyl-phosphate glucose phosphotransferase [Stellaceae bacterium]
MTLVAADVAVQPGLAILPGQAPRRINPRAVAWALRVGDAVLLAATGVLAYWLQPALHSPPDATEAVIAVAIGVLALRPPKAEPPLAAARGGGTRLASEALMRMLLPFALCFTVLVLLPSTEPARHAALLRWLILWTAGTGCGVLLIRLVVAGLVARWHRGGRLKQTVAIFGTGDLAARLLERLQATCADSIELVGVFDDRRRIGNRTLLPLVRGTTRDLVELSRQRMIDRVIVALPHSAEQRLVEVLRKLHQMPVEISLAPDMVGFSVASRDSADFGGLPLIDVYGRPLSFGQNLIKNAFDKIVAVLALIVASPAMLACAVAIKLDSRGPVLFCQNRLGFGDRIIRVYKFRSMYHETADLNGERQATRDDPRITRVGRFLRKSSLDELPQLFNVLRGEMSLVGPRPHAVAMQVEDRRNEDIVPDYALRHHVKPGITGWAQVNGYIGPVATEEALRARVAHDLDYINNWSLWLDIRSLILTIRVFIGKRHVR